MNRPYITINCAMTADGKISLPNGKQLRISSDEDIKRMYELRNENDAIIVGINTVINDDPKLTVKETYVNSPKNPIRIVLDTNCKIPDSSLILNDKSNTIIVTSRKCDRLFPENIEIIICETDGEGLIDIEKLLDILYNKGIKKLMVEGGSTVIWNFINKGFYDDLYVYIGSMVVGGESTPTLAGGKGIECEDDLIKLKIFRYETIGPGILIHYRPIL
jgi:2,5-diamino-6-(ribosylamino)-4(3H)-pyrimidinone 5'-phosphate reductase